jgi:hypothetical protein
MFLDTAELQHLTGYVYPARQIAWLKRKGYRHDVNGAGLPVVSHAEYERKTGRMKVVEPNWGALT